ncbi:MccA (plasmid) [Helicobacter pylori P12]|nr:MccA [Helicobacter pylori P12]AJS10370.1 MccA [Helicobacter pylori]AJS10411.1 MccA [Helicobacter pylori]AJS10442.1 MccA-like protein [Helicobacter pylori]AJS10453.1 MccA-like protein [Helicobacter pylori]
MKLSYRN